MFPRVNDRSRVCAAALAAIWLLLAAAGTAPAQKAKPRRLKGGSETVLSVEAKGAEGMPFHLHLPSGWREKSRTKYPVLLALHGNGQAPEGILSRYRTLSGKKSPLVIIAPHYQKEKRFDGEVWPREACMAAFDWLREKVAAEWNGDPERFFVQGFSMGGSYASLYVAHLLEAAKAGGSFPIRAVILNSGTARGPQMKWPKDVPSLFIVGEKETAVRGTINVVESMRRAANAFLRQGGDVRFHLIPGMGHAVNQDCLDLANKLIFQECEPLRSLDKEIAGFKRGLRREERPVTRLMVLERAAAPLTGDTRAERIHKSLAQLHSLPQMVRELEAWKQWEAAVQADREGAAERRAAYEALTRSHPDTEAGRRAKDRLGWID
jgi:dienelactone hydrolase